MLQVHVLFDNPGGLPESPKLLEQKIRDLAREKELTHHECTTFTSDSKIPEHWKVLLACRPCKKNLTQYLAQDFLDIVPNFMPEHNLDQEFFTIGENAYSTNRENEAMIRPTFTSNADEVDMRIWLHSLHSVGNRILVFSPDIDVYHIGLTQFQGKQSSSSLAKASWFHPNYWI